MVNPEDKKLFENLINYSIGNLSEDIVVPENTNWKYIYDLARNGDLQQVLYKTVMSTVNHLMIELPILEQWKKTHMISMLNEKGKRQSLITLLRVVKDREIRCILFKGIVLAELYPEPLSRTSSDTDIYVDQHNKEPMIHLLKDIGYEHIKDEKDKVFTYVLDTTNHIIELHFSLWEDYESEKISQLDSLRLTATESLLLKEYEGNEYYTLGYEEHLIFQMFHIIKHFTLQGLGLRYLIDVTLYVNAYLDKIDMDSFWQKMTSVGYADFCITFFGLCIDKFGMNSSVLNDKPMAEVHKKELLYEEIITGESINEELMDYPLLTLLTPYFLGNKTVSQSKSGRRIQVLFPKMNDLPDAYRYAKSVPVLLPVAWIHRMIFYGLKKIFKGKKALNYSEKLTAVEYRLNLLSELELIKKNSKY